MNNIRGLSPKRMALHLINEHLNAAHGMISDALAQSQAEVTVTFIITELKNMDGVLHQKEYLFWCKVLNILNRQKL